MRALFFTLFAPFASAAPAKIDVIDFNDHVQPILSEYCYHCHGPDSSTRAPKSEPLRLDREEDAFVAREDSGQPVIIKGDAGNSELMRRILTEDTSEIMPPPKAHKVMKEEEIAILKQWIDEGAPYEEHWAFIPPERPDLPALTGAAGEWVRNGIDAFVAEAHHEQGLSASPREEDSRLLRRLSLDLTGLPPTPEQLARWQGNVGQATDELLGTPEYAEHFGRHWLDAVRYGDTHGIHIDNYRSIWPYRDWVFEAFRQNMPYDQFTREQVAGDLLPNATLEQKVASGYNRCLPTTGEGGAIAEEFEAIYAQDRVDTTAAVWLGLTTGCAACHDHKFDPISQKDNYALTAFFRNSTMSAMDRNSAEHPPNLFVPALDDRERWAEIGDRIAAQKKKVKERAAAAEGDFVAWAESLRAAGPEKVDRPATGNLDQGLAFHLPLSGDAGEVAGRIAGQERSWTAPHRKFLEGPLGPATVANDAGISISDEIKLDANGQFSMGLLIYHEGRPDGPVIAKMDGQAAYRGWDFWMEQGRLGSHLIESWSGKAHKIMLNKPLAEKTWHHVVVTYDGTRPSHERVSIFVNGKREAANTNPNTSAETFATSKPLMLGARSGGSKLSGGKVAIQDFRIYDRVLTENDLAELTGLLNFVPLEIAATTPLAELPQAQRDSLKRYFLTEEDELYQAANKELRELENEKAVMKSRGGISLVMDDRKDQEAFAHILTRGDYRQKAEKLAPDVPDWLPPLEEGVRPDRLALANWLVDPANPLPARVTVNRVWYYFFGRGLVETTEDFGVMGARPTHPKLLDWLAVEFVESGWDFHHLLRLIVSSATYQQSGRITPELREADPDNLWLARGPRYRLDAEQIRDLALSASGLLVRKFGGPSVKPYQPTGVWSAVAMNESNTRFYKQDEGENLFRRSVYTFWKRTAPPASLDLFDAPSREMFCVRRDRTNTPLQALVLMNDPQFVEAARHLAEDALQGEKTFAERVDALFLALVARPASEREREILAETLAQVQQGFAAEPERAQELLSVGATDFAKDIPAPELASWTVLASQVLNLDETITK
ncbi:DUF1553 domain-containing protein [Roseibacillus ishigakijimensis]|uniref:DUF1553 domain-containing protein n=1 Tax=Roseibacillus ishigakijimensis TaxID=454146 RepID=A0A934RPA7_9BACT|nr:DUF1553 domain-containing protein [Roseibacillus ishigakijimensis]MBK1832993.1 DUF1553 domain-containing protein [Roseibacillus ishigakijimensis]